VTLSADVEKVVAQHMPHLQIYLQKMTGSSSGLEEGSDGWSLLNALTGNDEQNHQILVEQFEHVGHVLAEQGGKLDVRLRTLQECTDALIAEWKKVLQDSPELLVEVTTRLYQLYTQSLLALTRGYQNTRDQQTLDTQGMNKSLECRLKALQRINAVSNSATDLDQTLEVTARAVAEELRADLCSIFFYDETQRVLTLRATNGPRPLGGMHFTLRLGEGYSGWVADKCQHLLANDTMSDMNFASEACAYPTDLHGLMALPIIFYGDPERLIGVISVQSHEKRDFSQDEMSFVEIVAGIAAINIENGRLYEQTDEQLRRKVYELATIHRVTTIIASTLNLDEVLQMITTQAVHLSGAERSCIFKLDPDRQKLDILAHYGFNSEMIARIQIGVGQCCAGRCVQTGRPKMDVDCFNSDETCFIRSDPFISSEIHSVLCVPLKVKQKILGCICIYSSHRYLWSSDQMQLVIIFANEAAIAIENAGLYEETRRGLELKSVLLRELHHRVKNNLATVASILSLQRRRTRSPEIRSILAESVNRVQGLASTHDLLAHEDVSEARLYDIARKIAVVADAHLRPPEKRISFDVQPSPIVIPSRAVTVLALVMNEMISNAIKHGLAGVSRGTITIRGREEDGMVVVQVIDSGKGSDIPIEETVGDSGREGLGVSLINHLIGELGGKFSLRRVIINDATTDNRPVERTVAEVRFPLVDR
jgi:two-component system, sensor histidine kinase PdtaS